MGVECDMGVGVWVGVLECVLVLGWVVLAWFC